MAAQVIPFPKPAPAAPTLAELVERVRELAKKSENIEFDHPHLQQKMLERGIVMRMIVETLLKGEGMSGPKLDKYGDWRIKMRRLVAGRRVQVVVAVREKDCTVVTAI